MNVRTKLGSLFALCFVLGISVLLTGSALQVPSGTWQSTGSMSESRDGAAAVALPDGRVLVIGGDNGNGPTASVDIFSATGVFSAGSNMLSARSGHTATLLTDGRVLVVGGTGVGGALASAEIYDPADDSWSNAGALAHARSGHTATRLPDGTVLIAGGGSASLEIYDGSNSFASAGNLSVARSGHAAAELGRWPAANNRLIDRVVIFVGGSNGGNALASTEIYDPATGQVSAGPSLPGPRTGAAAATVLGGYAYVSGGNDGSNDLSSALLISRDGAISAAPSLLSARSGHFAVRLPGNNSVLIAGGSGGSSAELFIPWTGQQIATGSMGGSRPGAASASVSRGLYLAAGGSSSSSSEVYGYATVDTDMNDYSPGEVVAVSGSGWTPGETVNLVMHEDVNPEFHGDITGSVTADGSGNISVLDFYTVEAHDRGLRFFLTATGATSGHVARATFTDALRTDFRQCANKDNTLGVCHWINSIVQQNNSRYFEGMSVPQRAIFKEIPSTSGNNHSLTLNHQALKSSAAAHAYDFLTSYAQATADAALIQPGIMPTLNTAAVCAAEPSSDPQGILTTCTSVRNGPHMCAFDLPDTMAGDVGGDGAVTAKITAYELARGNRQGKIYGNANISACGISFTGYTSGSDPAAQYTITWTSTSTEVLIEIAGHISGGVDPIGQPGAGWGAGKGASSISGGPYHFKLFTLDGASLGNQDNQLKGADILGPATKSGMKFNDLNANGVKNDGEPGLSGWTINIYRDNNPTNGQLDAAEFGAGAFLTTVTDGSGNYIFPNVPPETPFIVCEVMQNGWQQSFPAVATAGSGSCAAGAGLGARGWAINLGSNAVDDNNHFGNFARVTIKVKKVMVGGTDTFSYTGTPSGSISVDGGTIEASVAPGQYVSTEGAKAGWALTTVVCDDNNSVGDPNARTATFNVEVGEGTITCTFTNRKPDAKITLDPLTATNRVGDNHVITATVMSHDGDGNFGNAPDGTTVTFSLLNNAAGAVFVGGVNTCMTSGGSCSVTINATSTGGVDIHATTTFSVLGISLTRATGTGGNNSTDAHKDYVNARIQIAADDTNEVNDPHTFTVTVQKDTGSGFVGVQGVFPTVSFTPSDPGSITDNCAGSGTNASGQCTVVINSSVAGVFTANASVMISVNGVNFNLSTDGNAPNSGPAVKTYVDARISLTPLDDTNPINEPHTIKATVEVNPGSGFVAAANGVTVTFSLQNSGGATATFVGGVNTCQTANGNGMCTVQINSPTPGTVTINASVNVTVGGVPLTRATNGNAGPGGSGPASKTYVAGKIIVIKTCEPEFDSQLFTFSGPGAISGAQLACFANGNDNQVDSGFLAPGNYSVSETVPAGWDLTSIVCNDDDNSGGLVSIPGVDLVLDASETITCTFHNVKKGKVIVVKHMVGGTDTFDYTGTPSGSISEQDGMIMQQVVPGQYSSVEGVKAGWDLNSIVCDDDESQTPSSGDVGTRTATFNVEPGETVTCVFTNTKRGVIKIRKIAVGRSANFPFFQTGGAALPDPTGTGVSGTAAAFNIITQPNPDPNNCPSSGDSPLPAFDYDNADCKAEAMFANVVPGQYIIDENQPNPNTWQAIAISCDDNNSFGTLQPDSGGGDNAGFATINVEAGETVTCTFLDRWGGKIRVIKQTDPDGDSQTFAFTHDLTFPAGGNPNNFPLSDGQSNLSLWQIPGTFNVTETVPAGWDLDSIECVLALDTGGFGLGDVTRVGDGADIELRGGQIINCTFNNVKRGRIEICKEILFGDLTAQFPFITTGDGYDGFTIGHNQCDEQELPPGMYSAREDFASVAPAGTWLLNALANPAIVCEADSGSTFNIERNGDTTPGFQSGDDTVKINLGAGGDVSCTFKNRLGGFIRIRKVCDPETDPTNAVFTYDTTFARTDATHPEDGIELMCGQNHLSIWQPVTDATNGTNYTVGENLPLPEGWTLTGIQCVVESGPNQGQTVGNVASPNVTVPLRGGQIIACTFRNTLEQGEGCTPGFWKNHTGLGSQRGLANAWPAPYNPATSKVADVWSIPGCVDAADPKIKDATLLDALNFKGGSGLGGAARNLLRHAVAALLNATSPNVDYPRDPQDVIDDVQAALGSCNRNTMLQLAGELGQDNELGCPLGGPATASGDDPVAPTPVADVSAPTSTDGSDSSFTQPSSEPSSFRLSLSGTGPAAAEEPKPAAELPKSQITSVTFKDGVLELSGIAFDRTGQPLSGVVGLTLALYSDRDGAPVWLDIHNVELDANGNFMLRLTLTEDVLQLEPSWLGVQVQGQAEQPRVSLH